MGLCHNNEIFDGDLQKRLVIKNFDFKNWLITLYVCIMIGLFRDKELTWIKKYEEQILDELICFGSVRVNIRIILNEKSVINVHWFKLNFI
jgi:hypothetical protein